MIIMNDHGFPDIKQIEESVKALRAVAEGYPLRLRDDLLEVENPEATAEAISLRGIDPKLVLDTRQIYFALRHVFYILDNQSSILDEIRSLMRFEQRS